jgi:hypothetical protein
MTMVIEQLLRVCHTANALKLHQYCHIYSIKGSMSCSSLNLKKNIENYRTAQESCKQRTFWYTHPPLNHEIPIIPNQGQQKTRQNFWISPPPPFSSWHTMTSSVHFLVVSECHFKCTVSRDCNTINHWLSICNPKFVTILR